MTNLKQVGFALRIDQIEWLRREFGHSKMSAGMRALVDEAMQPDPEESRPAQPPRYSPEQMKRLMAGR